MNLTGNATLQDKKEWQKYLDDRKRWVSSAPADDPNEPIGVRAKRIERLLGNFDQFCQYYFSKYMIDEATGNLIPFGWFHRKAAKDIEADPNFFGVLEWPREHAKSVFAGIFMPLYLKAKGELTGMVIVSNNQDKAIGLLSDVRAELEANKRYIADFGEQRSYGDWQDNNFTTQDGTGFWALGRGQSPRGLRSAENRPNYVDVDDFDDEELVRNEGRVQEAVDWLLGGLYGAVAIKQGRFVMVGNRIHKKSSLAHIVGDIEEGQTKKPHVYHLKVFALENPKTHKADQSEKGVPAWKENYTAAQILLKMERMGYRVAQREFFHKHIVVGIRFKSEWLTYVKIPKLTEYPFVVIYNDPSFKGTKSSDYKALVAVGPHGHYRDLIKCWIRQATKTQMVVAHYDMYEWLMAQGVKIVYNYIEGGFIQPDFLDDYQKEGESRDWQLMVKMDDRKKPDKLGRIEDMQPGFERGFYRINEALRNTTDYQNFEDQLLGFPNAHDDGPDAFEGAVHIVKSKIMFGANPMTIGGQRRSNRY